MNLKDKITNKEDLILALTNTHTFTHYSTKLWHEHGITPAWWAIREEARISNGVYELTEALEKVNKHAKVFAHVSLTDKTKVAFTPDKAFGERDAQLTMNFGKMVQRVIPFASEEYVKTLTEDHTADLSDEVEWITGPEIANVYATTSVSSCMAKKNWKWVNPALAYDAPGIKLAVLRDSAGTINARCMVYENGEDKRLIRNYGDGRLLKRLTRLGYAFGGWQGVKFRTIKEYDEDYLNYKVAIPYLDSMNGPLKEKECTLMLLDGVLQGVNYGTFAQLLAAGVQTVIPSTDGYVKLKNSSSKAFTKKDAITGEDLNILEDKYDDVFVNGEKGVAKYGNIDREIYTTARKIINGGYVRLYVLASQTFNSGYGTYFDGDKERTAEGYVKLSSKYYDNPDWVQLRAVKVHSEGQNHLVKREDAVHLYNGSDTTFLHKSELTKEHIRVADYLGDKYYVTKDVEILRTPSKAKVVRGLHDIAETWNGWDYERNLQFSFNVYGNNVYCKKSDRNTKEFQQYLVAECKKRLEEIFAESSEGSIQYKFTRASRNLDAFYVYPNPDSKYSKETIFYTRTAQNLKLDAFKEFLDDYAYYGRTAVHTTLVNHAKMCIAEMEAVNGEEPVVLPPIIETPPVLLADRFALAA